MLYHNVAKTPKQFTTALFDPGAIAQFEFQVKLWENNKESKKMIKEQKEAMIRRIRFENKY